MIAPASLTTCCLSNAKQELALRVYISNKNINTSARAQLRPASDSNYALKPPNSSLTAASVEQQQQQQQQQRSQPSEAATTNLYATTIEAKMSSRHAAQPAPAPTTTAPISATTTTSHSAHSARPARPARPARGSRALLVALCLGAATLALVAPELEAASARVNMHQVSRQTNQFFLNEFCDLESKTIRSAKKLKQASDTHSLFLTSKNTLSSVRVLPQKQQMPSSISFGFGSSQQAAAPIYKQLNCSIIVVAPKSHGLLVTVNSIGLPKNLTKLGITLNHDSAHAQHVHLEGETTSANYLLTQPSSSKIAINLQSFQPIDWSHVSFDILFTVYKKANSTGGCPNKKWFDCGDNICVPSSLICDNNRNCPNGNDEMIFYRCYSPLFWSIAASTLLALLLVALITGVLLLVRRGRGLSRQHSFSNNVLHSEGDLMHDNNSSHLDLTQESGARSCSYLASNLYLGGFENPVWTNGTLTKQPAKLGPAGTAAPAASAEQAAPRAHR